MKTLSFWKQMTGKQEIEIGKNYYFGQLWDGEYNGSEILESGSIAVEKWDGTKIVYFKVIEENEDTLETIVEITDIL